MKRLQIRDDLTALEGYHSIQVDAEVRLNTNESPFPPSAEYLADLCTAIEASTLNRYPDRAMGSLRHALGDLHGVSPAEVFCANGSNEVLQSICLAYGGAGRSVVVFEPTYALHSHIARITGTDVIVVERDASFELDDETVATAISAVDPAITFLCSPNNPTGLIEPSAIIEAALESSTGLVVVDEAYGQFSSTTASALRHGPGGDRLAVSRTFSKTWALAGLRLGYLEADPAIIEGCEIVGLPYNVGSITQIAGLLALEHLESMEAHVVMLVEQRSLLLEALRDLEVDVWPSESNFILFRPRVRSGHEVWSDLLAQSVLIRDCSSWPRLSDCLRVTVGTPVENDRFIHALKEAL
jgi:histidinol-phosphate aminotransferase